MLLEEDVELGLLAELDVIKQDMRYILKMMNQSRHDQEEYDLLEEEYADLEAEYDDLRQQLRGLW